jgi:DNA-binding response OmpR family regulator
MSAPLVLLLEDDAALCGVLHDLLIDEGFEAVVCESYRHLLQYAEEGSGDLCIADFWGTAHLMLDEAQRMEILRLAAAAPLILLTGRTWATELRAGDLGAVAIVRKPFDVDVLMGAVNQALQGAASAS